MKNMLLVAGFLLPAICGFAQFNPLLNSEQSIRHLSEFSAKDRILPTSKSLLDFNKYSKGNDSLFLLDSVHDFENSGPSQFSWYAYTYNSKGMLMNYLYFSGNPYGTLNKETYSYLPNDSLDMVIYYNATIQTYPSLNTVVSPDEIREYSYDSFGYLSELLARYYYPSLQKWNETYHYDAYFNLSRTHRKDYLFGSWVDNHMYEYFYNSSKLDTASHYYVVLPDSSNLSHYSATFCDYDSLDRMIQNKSYLITPNGLVPNLAFFFDYDSYGNISDYIYHFYLKQNNIVIDTLRYSATFYNRGFDAPDSILVAIGATSSNLPDRSFLRYFYTGQSLLADSMHTLVMDTLTNSYQIVVRSFFTYDSMQNLTHWARYSDNGNQWVLMKEMSYFYNWHHPLGISTIAGINAIKHRVYPNPALDFITLEFENSPAKNTILQVYSTDGRKVMDDILLNSKMHDVDISRLLPGIYLYRIISPASDAVGGKFIKQ